MQTTHATRTVGAAGLGCRVLPVPGEWEFGMIAFLAGDLHSMLRLRLSQQVGDRPWNGFSYLKVPGKVLCGLQFVLQILII